jgi:hypothetical protein
MSQTLRHFWYYLGGALDPLILKINWIGSFIIIDDLVAASADAMTYWECIIPYFYIISMIFSNFRL